MSSYIGPLQNIFGYIVPDKNIVYVFCFIFKNTTIFFVGIIHNFISAGLCRNKSVAFIFHISNSFLLKQCGVCYDFFLKLPLFGFYQTETTYFAILRRNLTYMAQINFLT